ncbi:MAG TPA: hypothetical protein VGR36_00780 [Candidatus Acidoferrales bacterium]|nr:hypothetical protein [Candidatus Acidoferrales bacterium]
MKRKRSYLACFNALQPVKKSQSQTVEFQSRVWFRCGPNAAVAN